MPSALPSEIVRYARAIGPRPDAVLEEMNEHASEQSFPTVGPVVGGILRVLTGISGARRIFEFGSGFGYSAYWFAGGLPDDGEIILTEIHRDELDLARDFLGRGGFDHLARYEHGDALSIIEDYEGPFDIVLVDHEKHRYRAAFEAIRPKLSAGGLVIADNVVSGPVDFDDLLAHVEGGQPSMDESTAGIAEYLDHVREDPTFETILIPYRSGITVSRHRPAAE